MIQMLHISIVRLLMLKHWNFVMGKEKVKEGRRKENKRGERKREGEEAKGKHMKERKKRAWWEKKTKSLLKNENWKHASWIKSSSGICCGHIQ